MDNPYAALLATLKGLAQEQIPVSLRLGIVTSIDPLQVRVAGTIQTRADLLINQDISPLERNDRVLLLPIEDEQRYILVCKVV